MKILLVLPALSTVYSAENGKPRLPHIGLAYLSAFLKQENHQVHLYDCSVEGGNDTLFKDQTLLDYDVVGISLYSLRISATYFFINKICSYLKKQSAKKVHVVLGGAHVSVSGKEALERADADFGLFGEAELTFFELLTCLENKTSLDQIKGLIWKDQDKNVIVNPHRELIENIDMLPFPDFSIFKIDRYMCHELKEMPITTSRGCPYRCNFCSVKFVSGKKFRARSPQNVFNEMRMYYDKGIQRFYISDDLFNFDVQRAEEICDLIINSNMSIQMVFQNGVRADYLNENLVGKLKKAGCTTMTISAESGNDDVLKVIKKNLTVETIKKAVDMLDRVGINFVVNFIIGHPSETFEKGMQSINLAKEIAKRKNCITIMFFNLVPYPSTEVFDWVDKNARWVLNKEDYLESSMDDFPVFETDEFTTKERVLLLRKGRAIHRRKLLSFILGEPLGFLAFLANKFEWLRRFSLKLAFNKNIGQKHIYGRYLRKIYNQ